MIGEFMEKRIVRTCDNCGNVFEKYDNNSTFNFCCRRCKGEWQVKNMLGENNPFYGKKHTQQTKELVSIKNSHPSIRKGCTQPQTTGELNPSYKNGYWMIRNKHLNSYLKPQCEICGNNNINKLEIHHDPSMDEINCLTWVGKVVTLCRRCHMNKHRDNKGRMKRIYEKK